MSYFSLRRRVPEGGAVEPQALTWLYGVTVRTPMVRAVYRRFFHGVLRQEVRDGLALDLGTGPGYVAVAVARQRPGLRIAGLDLSGHMVERAERLATRANLNGRVMWPQADGHRLPFADQSVHLVFSSFALHHWREPLVVLDEIARVLAPGGRYYVADLCRKVSWLQRAFAYASIPVVSLPFGSYRGYGGYYESVRSGYTQDEARDMLSRSRLPSGQVELDSTALIPILTIASRGSRSSRSPTDETDAV
jgi:ubiquinone/menaquinone biosynthesis C-methylase UbiE